MTYHIIASIYLQNKVKTAEGNLKQSELEDHSPTSVEGYCHMFQYHKFQNNLHEKQLN